MNKISLFILELLFVPIITTILMFIFLGIFHKARIEVTKDSMCLITNIN